MKLVLREENNGGSPDLVVEQHHGKRLVAKRVALDIYTARISVRCRQEGIVLDPNRVPGAQRGRQHLRGLAVGTTPLFDDGRPLPNWPKRETSDGISIRVEIDCPEETKIEVSLW